MEGMTKPGYTVLIHGNVTMKPPVQLLYTDKTLKNKIRTTIRFCCTTPAPMYLKDSLSQHAIETRAHPYLL
jgi:hypothetical protein